MAETKKVRIGYSGDVQNGVPGYAGEVEIDWPAEDTLECFARFFGSTKALLQYVSGAMRIEVQRRCRIAKKAGLSYTGVQNEVGNWRPAVRKVVVRMTPEQRKQRQALQDTINALLAQGKDVQQIVAQLTTSKEQDAEDGGEE